MRPIRLLISGLFLSLWAAVSVRAEPDSLQMRLYHGLDEIGSGATYSFNLRNSTFWSKLQGNASGLYRRPLGSQGDVKTEALIHGEIGRPLRSDLDLMTVFESSYYRFQQYQGPLPLTATSVNPAQIWNLAENSGPSTGPTQQINRSLLGLGSAYHPGRGLRFTGLAGGRWDRREGFDDRGYNASLTAQVDCLTVGGYWNDLDLFAEHEKLQQRLNHELRLDYGLEKTFTPKSSDRLMIHYRRKRYDYHIWGTPALGTRLDGDRSFQNQLRYDVSQSARILWDIQLGDLRHEDRSSSGAAVRQETNSATALTLRLGRFPFSGWMRLRLEGGDQQDATGLKREKGTALENGLSWMIHAKDSLDFSTSIRKKQYDTSDTANFDDRDRLRYEIDLFYQHAFDPRFRLSTRTEVILEHSVYIFAEKSDQNNWNRIFKVIPEVYFEPTGNLNNLARFELVANTTDYDFELDPANIHSTIYRRYTASDSLTWSMPWNWRLTGKYSLSLEDGGRLLWDQWVQQLSDEYRSHTGSLILQGETHSGVRLDLGLSFYERRGWEYTIGSAGNSQKSPVSFLTRWGPLLRLIYPSDHHVNFEAVGDLSWVHEWGHQDYTIVNLDMRATWR